jgi:hypothetical protein
MGHSDHTPNVTLPQYVDDDKPSWLGDVNETNRRIDAEFARLQGLIDNLQTQVNNKVSKA